ncbi:hypothetical protein QPK87_18480, partial [Kamptonema cortianum]|nr:hypothetical protein [Kamptonema cortianum]
GGQQGGGVGRQGQGGQGGQQGGGVGRQGQGGPQGGPGGFGDPAAMEKMRAELEKKILAVLTDAQRSQWTKMLGAKFEFTRMQQPPRPGGGGRGDGTLEF